MSPQRLKRMALAARLRLARPTVRARRCPLCRKLKPMSEPDLVCRDCLHERCRQPA